jgi:hypothetical protein
MAYSIVEEDHGAASCSVRFSAESMPSLRLGCVLGFRRVFAESMAWVVCLGSAESLPSLRSHPQQRFPFTIKACEATGDNVSS